MSTYLLIGGARSGKSRWAIEYGKQFPQRCYIATAQIRDDEMAQRAVNHQQERGANWTTIESGFELHRVIEFAIQHYDCVVIDCLTVWAGQWMEETNDQTLLDEYIQPCLDLIKTTSKTILIITNEVGTGIVPDNPLARRYRDLLGSINQQMAASCQHVLLFTAGIPLAIKGNIPK